MVADARARSAGGALSGAAGAGSPVAYLALAVALRPAERAGGLAGASSDEPSPSGAGSSAVSAVAAALAYAAGWAFSAGGASFAGSAFSAGGASSAG